ncbi:synaptotagmin-1-like isoform X2 [Zingiber officinale]|uniref:synaptotagmin-1-like isoform X2 n=1 Tax=Zingiber officinale TaxID=94328 RepID=UPI001C4A867C|nr:synaptotagmin-1-like isoform X2 [Zingiber officinale]
MGLFLFRREWWRGSGRKMEELKIGLLSTALGFFGFGVGLTVGAVVGFYLFIRTQPSDVEAICKTAMQSAEPIMAEVAAKYKIKSVKFETFTLGSLPPSLHGMKVYISEENELILEPSLKWAGNPNIIVVARAYGLRLTVQVVDLQIFALPRLTLKPLVPSFPCFANIYMGLMEKPHVDFGVKLSRADLMAIPGLYIFVQETIKDQVANMFLWPKTLEVPILDVSKALKKPVGILYVKVIRAYELPKEDLFGKSDPYVKLRLSDHKLPSKKTSVKRRNLEPEWNEEFKFVIKDPESQVVELNVYDWEQVGRHKKMGMNVIKLNEVIPNKSTTLTLDLLKDFKSEDIPSENSQGQIVVEVNYKPFKEEEHEEDESSGEEDEIEDEVGPESEDEVADKEEKTPKSAPPGGGLLIVIVHEGKKLEGKHHINPYARVTFRGEKKKTKHKKHNRDPRWKEEFLFVCEEPPVHDKLLVEVFSKAIGIGIHYSKESLGYVTVDLADVVNNKRTNEIYHLIDSKNGQIQVELQWNT